MRSVFRRSGCVRIHRSVAIDGIFLAHPDQLLVIFAEITGQYRQTQPGLWRQIASREPCSREFDTDRQTPLSQANGRTLDTSCCRPGRSSPLSPPPHSCQRSWPASSPCRFACAMVPIFRPTRVSSGFSVGRTAMSASRLERLKTSFETTSLKLDFGVCNAELPQTRRQPAKQQCVSGSDPQCS